MRRSGYGISVDVPQGWAHSFVRRSAGPPLRPDQDADPRARSLAVPGPTLADGERTLPVVHVCSRPIPSSVGDFGAGLVEQLGSDDVFVALLEYGSDLAGTGLFSAQGWPRLAPSQFSPARMQRAIPGRSASQHFFSVDGRAFCLYAVIGSHSRRMVSVPGAARVARSMGADSAATMRRRGVVV